MDGILHPDDLGHFLGQAIDSDDRAWAICMAADAMVRDLTGQHITFVENDVLTLHPSSPLIILPERPVLSVSAFTENGVAVTDYVLDGPCLYPRSRRRSWADPVVVTYTHGYREVPRSVLMAASMLASEIYSNTGGAITGERIGNYSYTVDVSSGGVATVARDMLRPYSLAAVT